MNEITPIDYLERAAKTYAERVKEMESKSRELAHFQLQLTECKRLLPEFRTAADAAWAELQAAQLAYETSLIVV